MAVELVPGADSRCVVQHASSPARLERSWGQFSRETAESRGKLKCRIFRPPANAADPAAGCKLQAAWLEVARLQGCRRQVAQCEAKACRVARLQAARLQIARLQAARLQAASCKVAGCKAAGDRLRIARLQAPGLQSDSAILSRFDVQ